MTLSREVNIMTTKLALLEVAEKKPRDGFREVAFYRLTTKVKPTAAIMQKTKGASMSTTTNRSSGSQPSELYLAIIETVTAQPGIKQEDLVMLARRKAPGSTEQQALKTLLNLIHSSKRLRVEGKRGDRIYFINDGKAIKTMPAKAEKPAKVKLTTIESTAGTNGSACAKSQVVDKPEFSVLLSESGNLHISTGVATVVLNYQHILRLQIYIARLKLSEACSS